MTYLLDVNVLVALFDPDHVCHEAAHIWLQTLGARKWATCPITENGVARILGNPNYPDSPGPPNVILADLAAFARSSNHEFWPDTITMTGCSIIDPSVVLLPKHLTDIYLLALATSHGQKFATFDRRINTAFVLGGAEALHLIAT